MICLDFIEHFFRIKILILNVKLSLFCFLNSRSITNMKRIIYVNLLTFKMAAVKEIRARIKTIFFNFGAFFISKFAFQIEITSIVFRYQMRSNQIHTSILFSFLLERSKIDFYFELNFFIIIELNFIKIN